ncbi:hypothetical protein Bp8pS_098 [Bacillus phage vB_BpuM-BpSp]|nr:hypothetical protein Bp8pS_098 [Bacillus phage vB_BpuM-BpSp]
MSKEKKKDIIDRLVVDYIKYKGEVTYTDIKTYVNRNIRDREITPGDIGNSLNRVMKRHNIKRVSHGLYTYEPTDKKAEQKRRFKIIADETIGKLSRLSEQILEEKVDERNYVVENNINLLINLLEDMKK